MIKIEGLAELCSALKELPKGVQGQVLGRGVLGMAGIIRTAAKAKAPKDVTGLLRKAIVAWRDKKSTPSHIIYNVGVTLKIKQAGEKITAHRKSIRAFKEGGGKLRDAFYWKFIEFGSKKMSDRKFLRPAFEENKERAAAHIAVSLDAAIQKMAAKLGRK